MKFPVKLLSALIMSHCALTFAKSSADTIFYGGPIITVNQHNDEVEALAIQNGVIVAIGSKESVVKEWQTDKTKVVNLNGQTLMPGFVEPHVHIMVTSMFENIWLNLSNFKLPYDTLETISEKLRAELKNVPPGGWLAGFGVDPSRTSPFMAELNADVLDKVSTEVPIFIVNQSGHIAYANRKAFEVAGVTDQTPNPGGGGIYVKDAQGKLTGKLVEPTTYLPFVSKMPVPSESQLLGAIQKTMKSISSTGVTSVSEMSVGGNFSVDKEAAIYKDLAAKSLIPFRIRGYLWGESLPVGYNNIKPNEGDDRLRFIGVKYISDGSTQGLTAALHGSYEYPKGSNFSGDLDYKNDVLLNLMKPFFDQGWQISVHSNGDRAIDQTLDNYSKLLAGNPRPQDRRLRIEHFTVNNENQVKKAVSLGVVPSFTIGHVHYWGDAFNDHILGTKRSERIDPTGDFKRAGGRFSLHSDTPVSQVGPLNYITEAVTRYTQSPQLKVLGPDQRISVDDAIRGVTIDAAYQMMLDDKVGSLEVGKLADLVILEKNPRRTDPQQIRHIKVKETWIDGKPVSTK